MFNYFQTGALEEELNRVSEENRKLTEMLTVMYENYNALRNQLMDCMSKNGEKELLQGPSKKRKSAGSINNDNSIAVNGNSESSSTDEELSKKPREEVIKAKISRAYVRTEAGDTSLVSAYNTPLWCKVYRSFRYAMQMISWVNY